MNKLKKLFSKTIVGISLILGIFVGFVAFVAFGSSDVKADTRSISFVLGDSLSEGNPVEASRIVVAGGTDSVNGRNQSVPYQKARSFIVQTGRRYQVTVTVSWKQWGWLPRRMENSYSVYVPHGARNVLIQ